MQGALVLRPSAASAGGGEAILVPVAGEAAVGAELPTGTSWEVSVEIPGYWAPPTRLVVGPSGVETVQRVAIWPLGTLAGRAQLADPQGRMPAGITVSTIDPPRPVENRVVPKQRLVCPIDKQGVWRCNLPAGKYDLALSAEGFIPQYRWGLEVPAGKALVVGTLRLEKGASISGWVEVEEGAIADRCVARITPLLGPSAGRDLAEKLRSTTVEAAVGKDGFFQLRGASPGTYVVEAAQPGFAPGRAYPIEVWPGSETLIRQPLVLRRPLRIELAIAPGKDWRGKPWRATVFRASELSGGFDQAPAFDGVADEEGRVVVEGQAPGRFSLDLFDSAGNRLFSRSDLAVTGPADARQAIDIDLFELRGTLALGKKPLAARLWFGGRYGDRSVEVEADTEGRFQGVLPRAGRWDVQILASDPPLETRTRVEVKPNAAGKASVKIELPDTHLFGRVLDEEGRPVPGATVALSSEKMDLSVRTDGDGAFTLRGAEEGPVQLLASSDSPPGTGEAVSLSLSSGQPFGPVELRLRHTKPFTGQVVSALGPVAGATVKVFSRRPDFLAPNETRTDLEGRFTAQVAAKAETALVIVSPPGHALQAFEVPTGGPPAVLGVSGPGGSLEVASPYSADDLEDRQLVPYFFQNGLPLPIFALVQWTEGHGQSFADARFSKIHVPDLAPGEYRVCLVPRDLLAAQIQAGWTLPLERCDSGLLTAGGTLSLRLQR